MLNARPIVVDPNYVVLGGNMRLKAVREVGLATVPVYVANWEEAKRRRFIIKDNASFGEWDWDMLGADFEASELEDWGIDIPDYRAERSEVQDDQFDPPDEVTTDIQPGHRFMLGPHRLIAYHPTMEQTMAELMPATWADAVMLQLDRANIPEGMTDHLKHTNQKAGAGASYYIQHNERDGLAVRLAMREAGIDHKQTLIRYLQTPIRSKQDYNYSHLPIAYGWKPGGPHYFHDDGDHQTTLPHQTTDISKLTKPALQLALAKILQHTTDLRQPDDLDIWAKLMATNTQPDDVVLDTCAHHGLTMLVAHQLGRAAYCAASPEDCAIIIDRLGKFDPTLEICQQ